MSSLDALEARIVDVPDFPKPGVVFKDITPALADASTFHFLVDSFAERWKDKQLNAIVGIESRGFILGAAVAQKMGLGLILLRKPGKLPRPTHSQSYQLEYGQDSLEVHHDAFERHPRVALIDDVLATGGTAEAAVKLVEKAGGELAEVGFLMELSFLSGREKLSGTKIFSLLEYS